jgi:TRAP-type C4-dicarboxylate transport system permease small subunit
MRNRSAAGSSTPTSKRTELIRDPRALVLLAILIPFGAIYVIEAFTAASPVLRILLRSVPVLPVAVWTLWFDRSRPFEPQPPGIQWAARLALLVLVMAFAVALLGIGLNWLYDPNRVI